MKKEIQIFEYLKNEKSFSNERNSIFHIFKGYHLVKKEKPQTQALKVSFLSVAISSSKAPSQASALQLNLFLIYACDQTYPQESRIEISQGLDSKEFRLN